MILTWDTLIKHATPSNILVTFLLVYIIWIVLDLIQTRHMPPGPWFGWPIIGHVGMLQGDRIEQVMKLSEKFGHVFTLKVGSWRTVFVMGEKAVKEVLVKKSAAFSGRPKMPIIDCQTCGSLGVASADNGPSWRLHRKMFMSALRDFMSDQNLLQERIDQEKTIMKKYFLENSGKPIDPDYILTLSVANVICHLTFGKHFEGTEPDYLQLMKSVRVTSTDKRIINATVNFIPWLRFFPNKIMKLAIEMGYVVNNIIRKYLKEHESTYDPSNIRDFIDGLLKAKQDAIEQEKGNIQELLSDNHMIITLGDMFIAGFETTATTLRWSLIFLANNPEVQQDVQEELDSVVGNERSPTLDDKSQLPLVEATIMEIQRLGDIVPEALPHKTTQDTTLCGYEIPEGTLVFVNLHSLHMDKNIYDEPQKFNPRRFIDSDGNVTTGKGNFLPFSAGRRVCAGESLAKVELFLFLSDILHNFTIKRKDETLISTNANYGITQAPEGYEVIFEPRKTDFKYTTREEEWQA